MYCEHTADIHSHKTRSITSLCVYKQRLLDKSYCAQTRAACILFFTVLLDSWKLYSFGIFHFSTHTTWTLRIGLERFLMQYKPNWKENCIANQLYDSALNVFPNFSVKKKKIVELVAFNKMSKDYFYWTRPTLRFSFFNTKIGENVQGGIVELTCHAFFLSYWFYVHKQRLQTKS